jgi:hypothetical protein
VPGPAAAPVPVDPPDVPAAPPDAPPAPPDEPPAPPHGRMRLWGSRQEKCYGNGKHLVHKACLLSSFLRDQRLPSCRVPPSGALLYLRKRDPSNKRWSILPMPWPRPGGEILFQWFRAGRLVDELSDLMKRRRPAVQAEIDRVYNEHLASRQSEGRRKSGWQQAITMPKSQAADGRAILSAIPRGKPVSCTHQDQSQNALRP